ncbi:serine/threonine-protein kinase [Nonomuraea zeae]|uniref:serine/threonine-protein kinase n=1 Tax=Nonomuraea zeae TaxID=1642303 RepID=UPI00197E7996|nr:serine/threonine-protein kinase [Nonomuraea zeae]
MISPDAVLAERYHLLSRLGSGGHGEVWRARDMVLDRIVAVKTVRAGLDGDPGFAARFHAEARSMASIDHPGVVSVFDYGIAELHGGRTPYLVMQYHSGEPLHRLLSRKGRVAAGATMDLVAQAAEALQAAHEVGVVHRDVKPGNLLIRPDGTVVLTDFGIARTTEGRKLTATGIVLGTVTYCAPEQAEGAAPSAAMDVYALGVVAYECLAGRVPFDGESAIAIALKHLNKLPAPLPADVPAAVGEIVLRALAKDPADRWPSAAALATAAHALVDDLAAGRPLMDGEARALSVSSGSWEGAPTRKVPLAAGGAPSRPTGSSAAAGGASVNGRAAADGGTVLGLGRSPAGRAGWVRAEELSRDPVAGARAARRLGRRALAMGGGLVAAVITAAAAWSLIQTDPPASSALGVRIGGTPSSAPAEPSPDLVTHTKDDELRDKPATPDTSTQSGTSSTEPDASTDSRAPAPATGTLIGGIVYLGGPSSGRSVLDGYRAGLVEVFTDKGRRVAGQRADRRGFRFPLPPGGYRLQTTLGEGTCSTTTSVKPNRTTRADLKCSIPHPLPEPEPGLRSAAVKDARGDAEGGPNAGEAPPYADLLAAAMKAGQDGVTIEFLTAGTIPAAAPSEGSSSSRWAVSVEQDGRTAILSLTGRKGAWTIEWAAKSGENGHADQMTAAAEPTISGAQISVAVGRHAPLKAAPIDFTEPYRIVGAESSMVHVFHGWSDSAP